jgi:hypothetical protein
MKSQKKGFLALFKEISQGYSKYFIESLQEEVFLKHPSQNDFFEMLEMYEEHLSNLKSIGILSEKEQIENASKNGWWSNEKENEILFLEKLIDRLNTTKKKLVYRADKSRIDEQIFDAEKKIRSLQDERNSYIVSTSENIASQKYSDFFIKNFFFKDKECISKFLDTRIVTTDPALYDRIFNDCLEAYFLYNQQYNSLEIKKLAISVLIQNIMFVSNSISDIFGLPISKMSKNQYDLILWAKYYQQGIKNVGSEVPESVYENPDTFADWAESISKRNKTKNSSASKRRGKNSNFAKKSEFLFGDRDEIESFTNSKITGDEVLQKATESGGMTFKQLLDS